MCTGCVASASQVVSGTTSSVMSLPWVLGFTLLIGLRLAFANQMEKVRSSRALQIGLVGAAIFIPVILFILYFS